MPKKKADDRPKLPDGLAIELQTEAHIIVQLVQKHYPEVQQLLDHWEGKADCPEDICALRHQLTEDVQTLTTTLSLDVAGMTRWWQYYIRVAQHEIETRTSQDRSLVSERRAHD